MTFNESNPDWENQVVKTIKVETPGKIEELITAGASFAKTDTPVDTGRLKSSITSEKINNESGVYGTNVEYAPYVEYGAPKRNIKPQPFMATSFLKLKKAYKRIFGGYDFG